MLRSQIEALVESIRNEIALLHKAIHEQINAISAASEARHADQKEIPTRLSDLAIPQEERKESYRYQKKGYRQQVALNIITSIAALGALIYAGIAACQLSQMRIATEQAKRSADTAACALRQNQRQFTRTLKQMEGQTTAQVDAAHAAQSAAETAQKTLEVQNRPWLSADVVPSNDPMNKGELMFDRDGNLSLGVTVKGQNFGKSIAQDIHIYAKLFVTRVPDPWIQIPKWQREVCDHPKITYVRPGIPFFPGFDLFPGQPYERGLGGDIDRADVIRNSHFYSDDPSRRLYIDNLYLVGCVDYRFSFGTKRHQTRFSYQITKKALATFRRKNRE